METDTARKIENNQWVIIALKEPILWTRSDHEVWMLNPGRRYIFNANQVTRQLKEYISTISDLKNSADYKPLFMNDVARLVKSKILIERYRDRGYGDLLFMTGVFNYLKHMTGGDCTLECYALVDRGQALGENPALHNKTTLAGPVMYDELRNYDYHWFVDSVTEYDEEPDQLNVYDALYKQIGIDPKTVEPRFKRPTVSLTDRDYKNLDSLFYFIWMDKKMDLRKQPYFVVAPLATSNLRSMPYSAWLGIISELSRIRPVFVIGTVNEGRMPITDMSFGAFNQQLSSMGGNVVNLIGGTQLRLTMALIAKASMLIGLDSGPLYMAQGLRVPAISIWGPHDPGVRIGYDRAYMNLAIWNKDACPSSPCFAYSGFPVDKCPRGEAQTTCECLSTVNPSQVIEMVQKHEKDTDSPFRTYKKA